MEDSYRGRDETLQVVGSDRVKQFDWLDEYIEHPLRMAELDLASGELRVFPRAISSGQLDDQFTQIVELQLNVSDLREWDHEDPIGESLAGDLAFTGLPDGFASTFRWGLGLKRHYRGLIRVIEKHLDNVTGVRFVNNDDEGLNGSVFKLSLARFSTYKKTYDLNTRRGLAVTARVNAALAHNALSDLLELPRQAVTLGRLPLIQAMTRELTGQSSIDADDRALLIEQTAKQSRAVASEAPEKFSRLRSDIELVSLEVLIDRFSADLNGAHAKDEAHWQNFFERNTFALQQLFAVPVALYGSQLRVKGVNIHGQGERIADFVLINTVTRTALVVEIKSPAAALVKARPYRGKGGSEVYVAGEDLLGAVSQVQAQMESVSTHLPGLLAATPGAQALGTLAVRGAVIVGNVSSLSTEQLNSLVRFRDAISNIEVVAFDEVRDRLSILHQMLTSTQDGDASARA